MFFFCCLHLKRSVIIIAQHVAQCIGVLYRFVYTPQNIPANDNFCLVCRQNRSLTLPLHCITYRMEHLDHGNLSLYVLSTFSTYHGCTCLLLLSVLSSVFQTAVAQPHSKSFYFETPTPLPQNIK